MCAEQDYSSRSQEENSLVSELTSAVIQTLGFTCGFENWFTADEFQIKILQSFLLILAIHIFMIYMAWKIYGPRIVDRFMKPVPNAVLEDLKQGATDLKLPREHSPRI